MSRSIVLKSRGMQIVEASIGESIEDYLEREYVTEGKTDDEIGGQLGLDGSTISRWRERFGVHGRPFGPRKAIAS